MTGQQISLSFVEKYSVWKVLAVEVIVGAGAVVPLIPHFSDGLVYTAFWYTSSFFPILLTCCAMLGFLFLASLPMVWRALVGLPAIVIADGRLTVYSNWRKTAALEEIREVQPQFGNALIKLANRRSLTAPVFLCEQPALTLQHLQAMARSQNPA